MIIINSFSGFNAGGGGTYTVEQTIEINFSGEYYYGDDANSNNFKPSNSQIQTTNGYTLSSLKNTSNVATGVNLSVGSPFGQGQGANGYGYATGNLQIFADIKVNSGIALINGEPAGTLILSGLDPTKPYHLYALATLGDSGGAMRLTIDATNYDITTTGNYPLASAGDIYINPAFIKVQNFYSDGSGNKTITLAEIGGNYVQPIASVWVLERSNIPKS